MTPNLRKLMLGALACAALPVLALPVHVMAASKGGHAKTFRPTDLAGMWESPWPGDQLRQPGDPQPPVEVGPPPLKAPYLAEWRAQQKEAADAIARGAPTVTNGVRCIPGGFPAMMGPVFPLEVVVTPREIVISNEAFSQTRRIYMNEKQIAVEDAEPVFFGHSVGRWEGKTLVVNTIGMKDSVRMRGAPHSPNMKVDERLYLTSPATLEDRITITDPEYLTEPWTFTYHYKRKPDYKIGEYICENNREFSDSKGGGQIFDLKL